MGDDYPTNHRRDYKLDTKGLAAVKFGREMQQKEFILRKNCVFMNHGSYGVVPKRVFDIQHEYNLEREEHPDLWFRFNSKEYMNQAREVIAEFINAKVENVVLLPNVTTAMNLFIREYPFKEGEAILDNTKTYGSIRNTVSDCTSRIKPDVERIQMELNLPITSEEDVINRFKAALDKNPNIRMALLDHITSPSSILMPLKKLVELFHSRGVCVFVDGAHSIGQLPLDMEDLKADGYTTNLYKWMYSPRGCALLHFDEKHRSWIKPPITSWNLKNSVDMQFFDQGCRDHVPLICGRHGIEFFKAIGGIDRVVGYTKDLADKAAEMICKKHGLTQLQLPPSMIAPNMRMILLPPTPDYPMAEKTMWFLQTQLFGNSNIYGLVVPTEGRWYFRICTQIYNEMKDFEEASELLGPFLKKFCS